MQKSKILIVDDVEENLDILGEILNDYSLSMALNGNDALEILHKNKPDIVLLDVVMPDIDGFEVCKIIKSKKEFENIPIIFITAKNDPQSITKGFEAGGVDYITKPFNSKELIARVQTHINLSNLLKEQEAMLFQQSKLASMGEMMDAVAHQWMQPLNLLQMKIGNIYSDYCIGDNISDEKYLNDYTEDLYNYIEHMSITLQEFRSFFRPDKVKKNFTIETITNKISFLLKDDLINHNIELSAQIDENFEIYGYENEFIHIFLNLISNSKYAFIDNELENRTIEIKAYETNEHKIVAVQDNAGGIPKALIDTIFNQNISTKGSDGTGIGLFMTKRIVHKHNGEIKVMNYQNGAIFFIEINK
jgi:two-component system, sensor histidine kinase and response regulator